MKHAALMAAAGAGHLPVVAALLEAGVDVNAAGENGWTALMMAAQSGHVAMVEELLEADADNDATDSDGDSAAVWAQNGGHAEVVKLLGSTASYTYGTLAQDASTRVRPKSQDEWI